MSGANGYHSGGYVAQKCEQKGALVERADQGRQGWWIRHPNGSAVYAPDRGLYPQEYSHIKSMIRKIFGIVLIIATIIAAYLLGG